MERLQELRRALDQRVDRRRKKRLDELYAALDKRRAVRGKKRPDANKLAALKAEHRSRIDSRKRNRRDAEGDQWITTENGAHILLSESGEVKAGMGGKFNGENIADVPGVGSNPPETEQPNNQVVQQGRKHEKSIFFSQPIRPTMIEDNLRAEFGNRATAEEIEDMKNVFGEYEDSEGTWYDMDTCSKIRAAQMGNPVDSKYLKYANAVEKYIELSPKWNGGTLYRGLNLSQDELNKIKASYQNNEPINMRGLSSWSSNVKEAKNFANYYGGNKPVLCYLKSTQSGTSVNKYSPAEHLEEVAISGKTSFSISSIRETRYYTHLELEELQIG